MLINAAAVMQSNSNTTSAHQLQVVTLHGSTIESVQSCAWGIVHYLCGVGELKSV